MSERIYGAYLGATIVICTYVLIAKGLSYLTSWDTRYMPYKSRILYEIRQCEKELPRNQECEIMISAVPKQSEEK